MARYAEVVVGSFGHIIHITLDEDLSSGSPTLAMVFRAPDETTEMIRTAALDGDDASNKTMKYTTVAADFATEGEHRITAVVTKGAASKHYGRPASRVNASPRFS